MSAELRVRVTPRAGRKEIAGERDGTLLVRVTSPPEGDLVADSAEGVGYLLKDRVADVERFIDAVRRVGQGGSALDPDVVSLLLGRRRRDDPLETLTAREREVLELMAEGRSNRAICEQLVITERAVEKHVTSIFSKLGLTATAEDHRRVLAVLKLLRA